MTLKWPSITAPLMRVVVFFSYFVFKTDYSLCIAVWCRRTDELVDGPNSPHITPKALDRWEQRLSDVFEGRPYDMYDAALSDTVTKYPVDIQVNLMLLTGV